MNLTPNEVSFLFWALSTLLGVLVFVGILFIKYILKLGNQVAETHAFIKVAEEKHTHHDEKFTLHHERILSIEKKVFVN